MKTIGKATLHMTLWGTFAGLLVGALYGTLLIHIDFVGTAFGLMLGGYAGLVTGVAVGLLVGLLSRIFFYPPTNRLFYRLVIAVSCALFTSIGAFVALKELMIPITIEIHIIPPLIASLTASFGGQHFASWHIYETQEMKASPQKFLNGGNG